jgi:hypothetical protein
MRSKAWAVVAASVVALGSLVVAAPAGAVTGSFIVTCQVQGGIPAPPTTRTIPYEIHAPDSVEPGAVVDVPVTFGYPIPTNAQVGGAIMDFGGTAQASILANPGATEVTGTVRVPTEGPAGGAVPIRLIELAAFTTITGTVVGEVCTPAHPVLLAQVGIGVPLVSIGDGAIVEGSTGTRGLQLAVTLSRPAATDVTVPFTVEAGTATAGVDYTTPSGTVTIHAGQASGIATVRVRGDATVEPKENFRVRLHDPTGAALGRAVGTGRIIDDDPEPGPRISIGDASVVEGNRAVRSMRFVVSLSEPAAQPTYFHYRTVDGTAVAANGDYRAQEFDYLIPAGHSSITVPVPVPTDLTPEATKSFVVQLSASDRPGAVIGRAKGVGTIIDDD